MSSSLATMLNAKENVERPKKRFAVDYWKFRDPFLRFCPSAGQSIKFCDGVAHFKTSVQQMDHKKVFEDL